MSKDSGAQRVLRLSRTGVDDATLTPTSGCTLPDVGSRTDVRITELIDKLRGEAERFDEECHRIAQGYQGGQVDYAAYVTANTGRSLAFGRLQGAEMLWDAIRFGVAL